MREFELCITASMTPSIVTRNKRDFAQSPVPALAPNELVSAYRPADMEYGLVGF